MKTILSIAMLIVFGLIAYFLTSFLLNIAGLPGAFLAGKRGKSSKGRFIFGSIICALGQSYVYLAFIAFIVNSTIGAGRRNDVVGFLLWPFAFLAVFIPIVPTLGQATAEVRERGHVNAQTEALPFTFIVAFISFFVFAFVPIVMKTAWGWVPIIYFK
jgi:hypothetical protein